MSLSRRSHSLLFLLANWAVVAGKSPGGKPAFRCSSERLQPPMGPQSLRTSRCRQSQRGGWSRSDKIGQDHCSPANAVELSKSREGGGSPGVGPSRRDFPAARRQRAARQPIRWRRSGGGSHGTFPCSLHAGFAGMGRRAEGPLPRRGPRLRVHRTGASRHHSASAIRDLPDRSIPQVMQGALET